MTSTSRAIATRHGRVDKGIERSDMKRGGTGSGVIFDVRWCIRWDLKIGGASRSSVVGRVAA